MFIYRNLRPYYKFTLPPLDIDAQEAELWLKAAKAPATDCPKLIEQLTELRESGVQITGTAHGRSKGGGKVQTGASFYFSLSYHAYKPFLPIKCAFRAIHHFDLTLVWFGLCCGAARSAHLLALKDEKERELYVESQKGMPLQQLVTT